MTRKSSHRAKRPTGWLSGSRRGSRRGGMPLWQWFVGVPLVVLMFAGIALFVYLTMLNPKIGAGVRTETVLVLERVENRASDGALDTGASYLVVNVGQTRLKLAPRLPDWNQVAQGGLIEVDVVGTGTAVQAIAWRLAKAAPASDASPGTAPAPTAPAAPTGAPPAPR
jgi:hypothetical protein